MSVSQVSDLWERAYLLLPASTKAIIDLSRTNRTNVISAVFDAAKAQRQNCISKTPKWRWKKPSGEEIIMRDVLEKIMKWINKFKEVGDIVVQYDPVHAALPWAGVRFLLNVVVNDFEIRAKMICSLETIAELITRYRHFETIHITGKSSFIVDTETTLVKLYAEVFEFLAKAIAFFSESAIVRQLKSAIRSEDFWSMSKITEREAEIWKLGDMRGWEQATNIEISLSRLADQNWMYEQRLKEDEFTDLLCWLSRVNYPRYHAHKAEGRLARTGDWLLQHATYMTWRYSSSSQMLILHGIPGCGKTKLASRVIDALKSEAANNPTHPRFAYFYCDKTIQEAQTTDPNEIFKSIVRQLTVTNQPRQVQSFVLDLYKTRQTQADLDKFDKPALQIHESVDLILQAAAVDPVIIIIDGVDEVPEECRHQLLQALSKIIDQAENVTKILVTSRDDSHIFALLPNAQQLRIERALVKTDLSAFVTQSIQDAIQNKRLLKGKAEPEFLVMLQDFLLQGAGEMYEQKQFTRSFERFLLVQLQLQHFCRMPHEADIRNAFMQPARATVDSLFDDSFDKITNSGAFASSLARKIFFWLLIAKEPLSKQAFLAALSETDSDPIDDDIPVQVCQHLVILDRNLGLYRFAHATVHEFIKSRLLSEPAFVHSIVAERCLNLVIHSSSAPMDRWQSPIRYFDHYAIIYWITHFADSDHSLDNLLADFTFGIDGSSSPAFGLWLEDVKTLAEMLPQDHQQKLALLAVSNSADSALFLACTYGLTSLIDRMIQQHTFPWNQRNDQGHTGLYLAATGGHEAVVYKLLGTTAAIDIECGRYGSALHAACYCGHKNIVQLLLKANANQRLGSKFRNALEAAIWGRQEETALLILNHGIQLDQDSYDSAINAAASVGLIHVLDKLETVPFAVSKLIAQGNHVQTQMAKALACGHVRILERLLSKQANPLEAFPADGVAIAAYWGHLDAVCFCLDKGLSIEQEGQFGPALRAASLMNHVVVVAELLHRGANVNANWTKESYHEGNGNALYAAAFAGHIKCVKILLDNGAYPNAYGGKHHYAIHAAAHSGHCEIVSLLIHAGANVNMRGKFKDTFHAAAEGGHGAVLTLLVNEGYKFQEHMYEMPMSMKRLMVDNHSPRTKVSIFIHGPDRLPPHHFDEDYVTRILNDEEDDAWGTALAIASRTGHDTLVRTILSNHEALFVRESMIKDSFEQASRLGCYTVVDLFLQLVPDIIKARYWEALHGASHNHHRQIMDRILTTPWKEEYHNQNAIHAFLYIASYGNQKLLRSILNELVCTIDMNGLVPILLANATENGATEIVYDILKYFGVPDIATVDQIFCIACARGDAGLIKILLDGVSKSLSDEAFTQGIELVAFANHVDGLQLIQRSFPERFITCLQPPALIDAAINGHSQVVRVLLPLMRQLKRATEWSLVEAVRHGSSSVCEILIKDGVDVDCVVENEYMSMSPLQACVRSFQPYEESMGPDNTYTRPSDDIPNPWGYLRSDLWFVMQDSSLPSLENSTVVRNAELSSKTISKPPVQCSVSAKNRDKELWKRSSCPHSGDKSILEVDRVKTLEILLANNANPNFLGCRLRPPLAIAAKMCPPIIVSKLIEYGANIEIEVGEESLLQGVFKRGKDIGEVLTILLDAGITMPTDDNTKSAFFRELAKHIADNLEGDFSWQVALNSPETKIGSFVRSLAITPGAADDGSSYRTFVREVIKAGAYDLIQLLISHGADVNGLDPECPTYLQTAVKHGHTEIVRLLLASGAQVNLTGRDTSALEEAFRTRDLEMRKLLITHGAVFNHAQSQGFPIYHEVFSNYYQGFSISAILHGDTQTVKYILATIGPAGFQNVSHALISACKLLDTEILEFLLVAGFDPNPPISQYYPGGYLKTSGCSALHMACAKGNDRAVLLLIKHGANVNLSVSIIYPRTEPYTILTVTPLQVAAEHGQLSCLRLLFEHGVDYSLDSEDGTSALAYACIDGHIPVVRELLTREPKSGSRRLDVALEEAVKHCRLEVVGLILETVTSPGDLAPVLVQALGKTSYFWKKRIMSVILEFIPAELLENVATDSIPINRVPKKERWLQKMRRKEE